LRHIAASEHQRNALSPLRPRLASAWRQLSDPDDLGDVAMGLAVRVDIPCWLVQPFG
jgi:hypothetical protein